MITTINIVSKMDCTYICSKIQEALIKYQKNNPDPTGSIIVIDIKKPIDDNQTIPRLEHKLL
jgi:hypothetical protein